MKVFLIVVYYLPTAKSSAKLMHDLAHEFKNLGNEVTVITVSSNISEDYQISTEKGIRVLRVKSGKIDGANKVIRAINEIRLSNCIWEKGKYFFDNYSCDLVVWYSPSIFFGSLIKKIKAKYGSNSYLILRDIFPQWAVDTGLLKKGLLYRYFKKKEIFQYDQADVIGIQSPGNLKYFKENNLDSLYNIEVLYNWTNIDEPNVKKTNFRDQLGLQNKTVFFYGGNIGVAQDLENIVRLANSLKEYKNIYFLIVGDGTEVNKLNLLINQFKLDNIKIINSVDQRTYLGMVSEFDVGIISLHRKFKTPNFPGKMLGYMYFSKPILATINENNDLGQLIDDHKIGLVSLNGDDDLLKSNAIYLLENYEERKKMGQNGKKILSNNFSSKTAANQIISHFS